MAGPASRPDSFYSFYTLVRHGAYAVAANPDFEQAVEAHEIDSRQAYLVRKAGGSVFDSSAAAQEAARAENFPPGATHALPQVVGGFSTLRIGGADLYIPSIARRI